MSTSQRISGPSQVLIVEDDVDLLSSLRFAFEVHGFHVGAFPSAEALLAAGRPPKGCCLVVDQWLPGMSGLSLVQRLREEGCDRPVVLITTANAELARQAARAGVTIVDKPLLSDALIDKVGELLAPA